MIEIEVIEELGTKTAHVWIGDITPYSVTIPPGLTEEEENEFLAEFLAGRGRSTEFVRY